MEHQNLMQVKAAAQANALACGMSDDSDLAQRVAKVTRKSQALLEEHRCLMDEVRLEAARTQSLLCEAEVDRQQPRGRWVRDPVSPDEPSGPEAPGTA